MQALPYLPYDNNYYVNFLYCRGVFNMFSYVICQVSCDIPCNIRILMLSAANSCYAVRWRTRTPQFTLIPTSYTLYTSNPKTGLKLEFLAKGKNERFKGFLDNLHIFSQKGYKSAGKSILAACRKVIVNGFGVLQKAKSKISKNPEKVKLK